MTQKQEMFQKLENMAKTAQAVESCSNEKQSLFEDIPVAEQKKEPAKPPSREYWSVQKREVLGILNNWKVRARYTNKKATEIAVDKIIRFIEEVTT